MSNYVLEINATQTLKSGYTGKGVGIATLDSGVALHRELDGKISRFVDYIHGRNYAYDDYGHGTHVAGIICGDSTGVARNASIYAYKVLDSNGNGDASDVIRALKDIKSHKDKIKIVNISFGFLSNDYLDDQKEIEILLLELWQAGICVVCAAGNRGPRQSTITFPGNIPYIITVGSIDNFSGVGPTKECVQKPEILAPGRRILSLSNHGQNYCYKSGTSMSAPFVSGTLALALEKNPHLSCNKIKLLLYQTCTKINGVSSAWGMINVDKFMQMV